MNFNRRFQGAAEVYCEIKVFKKPVKFYSAFVELESFEGTKFLNRFLDKSLSARLHFFSAYGPLIISGSFCALR